METLITSGVEVKIEPFYQGEHSKPIHNEFVYAYRVMLCNHNSYTVQLLRRKWIITDLNSDVTIVEGDGVVGRQPVLYPGDSYEYVSGCNFVTPIGKMEGIYIFENKSTREEFVVKIPVFILIAPLILN